MPRNPRRKYLPNTVRETVDFLKRNWVSPAREVLASLVNVGFDENEMQPDRLLLLT